MKPLWYSSLLVRLVGGILLLAGFAAVGCGAAPEMKRAERLAEQGDWDGAVVALREAQKKDPFNNYVKGRLDSAKARAAEAHYAAGRRYLQDNLADALQKFKVALSLDPSRGEYHMAVTDAFRLKEAREQLQTGDKLRSLGRFDEAGEAYEKAVELDPNLTHALDNITKLTDQERLDKTMGGQSQPITLRFQNAKLKEVFEVLARAGNINVIFDRDVKDEPITIFIKDSPFPEALNLILSTNGLFSKRVGSDTLLVIPNNKQKQEQYQDQMIRTFYLSNARAKDMVNVLKTMLESKHLYVNEPINAIIIRDQPEKVRLAERIIMANDRRESEVEFDLEVLEVTRTKKQNYGIDFAKSAGIGVVPPGFSGALASVANQFTYQQLKSIGLNSFVFSLPTTLLLDFFKQESDAKTLASPKLRVLNGKQASVNVGDKQPILLSTTNVLPGQAMTGAIPTTSTVTAIEFKDTGVKVTVEPTIHLADELSLKLKVEVTKIGDQVTLQASPEIKQFRFGSRVAETTLNIKDGESVVLAGLIQDEDRKTRVTAPGLGSIPVLGHIFSTYSTETITTEVILTITPHIVRNLNTPNLDSQAFWSGTETTYATSPLFSADKASLHRSSAALLDGSGATQIRKAGENGAGAEAPPEASGTTILGIRPSELSGFVDQDLRVDMTVENMDTFSQSALTVSFDPHVLEFREAMEGEWLRQGATSASVTVTSANLGAGTVALLVRRDGQPASGSGVLGTLLFHAKAPGNSAIEIHEANVSGTAESPVAVATGGGIVKVK